MCLAPSSHVERHALVIACCEVMIRKRMVLGAVTFMNRSDIQCEVHTILCMLPQCSRVLGTRAPCDRTGSLSAMQPWSLLCSLWPKEADFDETGHVQSNIIIVKLVVHVLRSIEPLCIRQFVKLFHFLQINYFSGPLCHANLRIKTMRP
jgi:hypothetical protein